METPPSKTGKARLRPLDEEVKARLDERQDEIGKELNTDLVTFVGQISPGVDKTWQRAIDVNIEGGKQERLSIILATIGGVAEVLERMLGATRQEYDHVTVIVPDVAMSAGTIFALSANRVMMDHSSSLGPIDPQVFRNGTMVPAIAYLTQYERLLETANTRPLNMAEVGMLNKLDPGELYQYERARELTQELLRKGLAEYNFAEWEPRKGVSAEELAKEKEHRAVEVAKLLGDTNRWHTHSRWIGMETLRKEAELRIDDLADTPAVHKSVKGYFELLTDYMQRHNMELFVHTRGVVLW